MTPHRIETHEPTATNFRTIDYVRERTPSPQTKSIHWGLLGIWVKYNVFVPFLFIYLYLFSETRIQAMDFFVLWALSPEINLI